jgi:molecular chaperone DnaK
MAEFLAVSGVDLRSDPVARMRLRDACEATKVVLSTAHEAAVHVPFVHGNERGAFNLHVPVTRAKFEDLTYHLTDATIDACRVAVAEASVQMGDVDTVLTVGLATRTPSVRESVERFFGVRARRDVEPDLVVALGAAAEAGVLEGITKDTLLLDVLAHDLVVDLHDGGSFVLIERHTTIPTRKSSFVTTRSDADAAVLLQVREGRDGRGQLARFVLEPIPTNDGLLPVIEVAADVDANGSIVVEAHVQGTDIRRAVAIGRDEPERPGRALPAILPDPTVARELLIGPWAADLDRTVDETPSPSGHATLTSASSAPALSAVAERGGAAKR